MASAWLVGVFGLVTVVTNVLLTWWLGGRDHDPMKRWVEELYRRAQLLSLLPETMPARADLGALLDERVHRLTVIDRRRLANRAALADFDAQRPPFRRNAVLFVVLPFAVFVGATFAAGQLLPHSVGLVVEWAFVVASLAPAVYGTYNNIRYGRWIRMRKRYAERTAVRIRLKHRFRDDDA